MGRKRERETIAYSLALAMGGQGGVVLISGEAGVGKTTLLTQVLQEAERLAVGPPLVACSRCTGPDETPLYGPWRVA